MAELVYYFSPGSRYSYLSMSQVPQVETEYDVAFRWVPVNGRRIRVLRGRDPFQGEPQSGQYDWAYRERDAKAWADYYGIPFEEPADVDFDVEMLIRGIIAASRQGPVPAFAWEITQEVFARQSWPLDQAVVDTVANRSGLDPAAFERDCRDPEVQQQLEANCEEAVARGVFGTPSFLVDGELFWGNDRLVLVRHALERLTR